MNCHFNHTLLIFIVPAFLFSCKPKNAEPPAKQLGQSADKTSMLEADRNFSKLSEEKGMRFALLEYIDNKGVLLRPNSMPIVGGQAINYISQGNDSSFIMTWEPSGGTVAISGELGYTYGVYSFRRKATDSVIYGTYVSIWKKQPDGNWKFALETGNEGIE